MKLNKLFLFISLLLISPIIVNADCDSEKKHFETIKDEFKIYYEVDSTNKSVNLIIENPDLKKFNLLFYDVYFEIDCENQGNKLICKNFPANNYRIGINPKDDDKCELTILKIKLPTYNKYQDNELCNELDDFYLCKETIDEDIDYDTFLSRIKSYQKKSTSKEENIKEEEEKTNQILNYINNNKIEVIVYVLFGASIIITIILTIKSQKDRRVLK